MAKKLTNKKSKKGDGETNVVRIGSNSDSQKKMASYVNRLEECDKEIEKLRQECRDAVSEWNEDKKVILAEAAQEDGLTKKAVNAVVQERKKRRQADAIRGRLEQFEQDQFDAIKHALGVLADTPLGAAALGDEPDEAEAEADASA